MNRFEAITTTITIREFTRPEAVTVHREDSGRWTSEPVDRGMSMDICIEMASGEKKSIVYVDMPIDCKQFELLESALRQAAQAFAREYSRKA